MGDTMSWNPVKVIQEGKWTFEKIVYMTLFFFGIFVCLFVGWQTIAAESSTIRGEKGFLLFEMILGMVTIFVPFIITHLTKMRIPSFTQAFYWIFIAMAVFAGTGLRLIVIISFWDKLLHLGSAMMLAAVGIGLMGHFFEGKLKEELSPAFYLVFGFSFAMMCGVIWEFYEFLCDSLLGMNLQRFQTEAGQDLIGRTALMDTMGDMWVNASGALIFLAICFVLNKKNPQFFRELAFYKKDK